MDIAAQTEPRSVYNAFLRLKIHLLQQDSKAAGDQIKAMLSCEDFSHEVLRVSFDHTKKARVVKTRRTAVHLLADVCYGGSSVLTTDMCCCACC